MFWIEKCYCNIFSFQENIALRKKTILQRKRYRDQNSQ